MTTSNYENSSDLIDIANDLAMKLTEAAISDSRRKAKQDQSPDSQGTFKVLECIGCELDIGLERLKVAPRNLYCVFCAAVMERKQK